MKKTCQICKKKITNNQHIPWGRGKIHLKCYTPDKQTDYDIKTSHRNYSGERSPYWDWVEEHAEKNKDGMFKEVPEANPDELSNEDDYTGHRSYYSKLINDVTKLLSPRELQVFYGLKNGFTEERIALRLKTSHQFVNQCRQKIIKKFQKYSCKIDF